MKSLRQQADQIFAEWLETPPAEQTAFLDRACANNEPLRDLVERLLSSSLEETESFFMHSGGGLAGPLWEDLSAELLAEPSFAGQRLDRYLVLEEIGRGGMAVVYLAERADGQFEQKVAIKVVQQGLDSESMIQRFERERQIMAQIQHPNIAQLLDGGVAPDGRPYFVMELVDGQPIDHYCDRERLAIQERLQLFLSVAKAVDHAHRHLVIHRDIKPSNTLVTREGVVKLLDFGIAKWIDPEAPEVTLTSHQLRMMTPAYASPEQIRGTSVTTASDVYQLGLLLYHLLTGRSPYRSNSNSSVDLVQAIADERPTRPSSVIHHTSEFETDAETDAPLTAETISARRATSPARLCRDLSGDLDNILLKALRKEPERRYPAVNHLIEDLERFLDGRPVLARGDRLTYRLSKFVQRHRAAVAVSAAALFLFMVSAFFYTARLRTERDRANLEASRASQEAATAEEVSEFLVELFQVADPSKTSGNSITARELLDRGAERISLELTEQPHTQARLMSTIGRVYRNLGLYEPAAPLLQNALELRRAHLAEDPHDMAVSMAELGLLYRRLGRYDEAEELYLEALPIFEQSVGPTSIEVGEVLNSWGLIYQDRGDLQRAEQLLWRALDILNVELGPEAFETAVLTNNLALVYRYQKRPDAAEPLFLKALPVLEKVLGENHPNLAMPLNNLALVYRDQERFEEAEPLFRQSIQILETVYGAEHPEVAVGQHNLAELLRDTDRFEEAAMYYQLSLQTLEKTLGYEHPYVANSLHSQAEFQMKLGDDRQAEALFQSCLTIRENTLGRNHPKFRQAIEEYAELLRRLGRNKEAGLLLGRSWEG